MRWELKVALLGLVLLAAGMFLAAYPETARHVAAVPHEEIIASEKVYVEPGQEVYWVFTVPSGADGPRLLVRLDIYEGGNRDLDLVVANAAGYPIYKERVAGMVERSIPLPGPGQYKLVLSNAFSLVTSKAAYIEARLTYKETVIRNEVEGLEAAIALMWIGGVLIVIGSGVAIGKAVKHSIEEFRKGLRGE